MARRAWLGNVIVGAQFEADDAVGIVTLGGQHEHRKIALGADAAQSFQAVQARHHDVEDDNGVLAREGLDDAAFAVVGDAYFKFFLLEIFLEHVNEFNVVVYQQYFGHRRLFHFL